MENKHSNHSTYGKLQLMPVPDWPWKVVEIDFITDLYSKEVNQNCSIMVCCDKLTKMVHLVPFTGTPSAYDAALAYLKNVFYLHGLPNEIITDRGPQFTSNLWYNILDNLNIKSTLATTNHHETTGQVERLNQSIEQFLRCFIRFFDDVDWTHWLFLAEFVYNNSVNSSTGQPPFLSFNGYLPAYSPSTRAVSSLRKTIDYIPDFKLNIDRIRHILQGSQELYKSYADKSRIDPPTFKPGDLVWVKKPSNYIPPSGKKLCPRKYGPFKIIQVQPFNNYLLDLRNSPFPKRYPVFNICELEPHTKRNWELSNSSSHPSPDDVKEILDCKFNPHSNQFVYDIITSNNIPKSIECSVIDNDSYYDSIVDEFNRSHTSFT